jgi:hypothetical protein
MRRAFGFTGFGFGARGDEAPPPSPPPPPPPPSGPFPDPDIEDAGDPTNGWELLSSGFGSVSDGAPGLVFLAADTSCSAALAGTNASAFNAAVADDTLYHVAIAVTDFLALVNSTILVRFKGTFQAYTFSAAETISHDITTAIGDGGFIIYGDDTDVAYFTVSLIDVTA